MRQRSTQPERGLPSRLRIRSDRYGSEAMKDKQLSFNDASHICDCQSIGQKI